MGETIPRTTLTLEAYRTLRRAILNRQYPPGTKLVLRELAEALGLSPTPIKEALAALSREGLVQAIPHRGYQVPALSPEDIREIYEIREVLEGLAARLAAMKGTFQLADHLIDLFRKQREAATVGDLEAYGDLDLAFHRTLWEVSENHRLLRIAENLNGQLRLLISTSAAVPGRLPLALEEHEVVLKWIVDHNPEKAETAMRLHVRNAWRALWTHLGIVGEL